MISGRNLGLAGLFGAVLTCLFAARSADASPVLQFTQQPTGPYNVGEEIDIEWTCTSGCDDISDAVYYLVRGDTEQQIDTEFAPNFPEAYDFRPCAPDGEGVKFRVKVFDGSEELASVDSDEFDLEFDDFTGGSKLKVTSPNGGEVIPPGSTYTIRWDLTDYGPFHSDPLCTVQHRVEYTLDGYDWLPVATVDYDDTSVQWHLPGTRSSSTKVRVSELYHLDDGSLATGFVDASDGTFTIGAPLRVPEEFPTIQAAINAATSGDIIHVNSGIYNQVGTAHGHTGVGVIPNTKNYLQILAVGAPGTTVIDANNVSGAVGIGVIGALGVRINGFVIRNAFQGIRLDEIPNTFPNFTRIANCSISSCSDGVAAYGSTLTTISGCTISAISTYGVNANLSTTDLLIDNCSIRDGALVGVRVGMDSRVTVKNSELLRNATGLAASSMANDVAVENCLIEGNTSFGLSIAHGTPTITGNMIRGNGGKSVSLTGVASSDLHENVIAGGTHGVTYSNGGTHTLEYNTVADQTSVGLEVGSSAQVTAYGNLVVSSPIGFSRVGTGSITLECNDVWDNGTDYSGLTDPTGENGNFSQDPLFCDTVEYLVSSCSPCMPDANDCHDSIGGRFIPGCTTGCGVPSAAKSSVSYFNTTGVLVVVPEVQGNSLLTDITVRNAADEPLAGVYVTWTLGSGMTTCQDWQHSGYTDANGYLQLEALGGGHHVSQIQARMGSSLVSLTGGNVPTRSPDFDGASGDGIVNFVDLTLFASEFNNVVSTLHHDYNNDGDVTLSDLSLFGTHFSAVSTCAVEGAAASNSYQAFDAESGNIVADMLTRAREEARTLEPGAEHESVVAAIDALERGLAARPQVSGVLVPPTRNTFRVTPNPFQSRLTIHYELAERSPVAVRIFDLAGRAVREFPRIPAASAGDILWDGHDDSGQRLPAGLYFVRIASDSGVTNTQKVIMK